jgi:TonB family protein
MNHRFSREEKQQLAKDNNISGKVIVRFTISETGVVEKLLISSSADPLLDAEALRIISLLPAWKPGKLKGIPVSVSYTIPVNFLLK